MTTFINASTSGLTETADASGALGLQTANTTAVIIDTSQNANFTSTGAVILPNGTTNNRPTGVNGMIRYNTTAAVLEGYISGAWVTIKAGTYSISYLIVAGGGGGGRGSGGGAGGFLTGTAVVSGGTVYTATVGAGGTGGTTGGSWAESSAGSNSSITGTGISTITSIGGGNGSDGAGGGNGGSGIVIIKYKFQ